MPLESVSLHQPCPGFDGMRPINNASGEVLFEQRILFPLIFISIQQIFCLPLGRHSLSPLVSPLHALFFLVPIASKRLLCRLIIGVYTGRIL